MNDVKWRPTAAWTAVFGCFAMLLAACSERNPAAGVSAHSPAADLSSGFACTGRVEPVDGEVDVSAQIPGTIESVLVKEGDWVEKDDLLAVVDARREKAQLELAQARLARVKAGYGAEEIAAAVHQREALEADLAYARSDLERARTLHETATISADELESKQRRALSLTRQVESLSQQIGAMRRGPIPEEVDVASAEVSLAQSNYELRNLRAQTSGFVLHLYRHAGDYVSGAWPTPVIRLADTTRLQVRAEVGEFDVYQLKAGAMGSFGVFGGTNTLGKVRIRTILPSFAPKRLFDPDGNARIDTRTIQVLCDLVTTNATVYSGQRVLIRFGER